jgi:GTP pyrophosphokinase
MNVQDLGQEIDQYGQSIADHGERVGRLLTALHADAATLAAGLIAGSQPIGPLAAYAKKHLDPEALSIFESVFRIRALGPLISGQDIKKAGTKEASAKDVREQLEILRRLFLAMAKDLRVVLVLLASRLETLRYFTRVKQRASLAFAQETLEVFAPLANRLGLWQIKWELEDLGLRFFLPQVYKDLAAKLDQRRAQREAFIDSAIAQLKLSLIQAPVKASVSGRPKHIYSIYKKMLAKHLAFEQIQDLRAVRVIVPSVKDCYLALSCVHQLWIAVDSEYDDYIAKPKPNGYQSLHTVVTTQDGARLEVQIRTQQMHDFAEFGVAAHWRYKESLDQANTSVKKTRTQEIDDGMQRQLAWMRQLLNWQQELGHALSADQPADLLQEQIYVLTPDAKVIELPAGATAVDFAYHVHTNLGHRCRGAKINGHLVALQTALANGQTIEIISARTNDQTGPSRDWSNPELGFVVSHRARAKVRHWFNAQELSHQVSIGRAEVEKALQREGKTALPLDQLAAQLGMESSELLFVAMAKGEIGPRQLEGAIRFDRHALAKSDLAPAVDQPIALNPAKRVGQDKASRSDVLVVGVDLLLTQLARCCRPLPPDSIAGYVTRGKGISIHRANCVSFKALFLRSPERVIDTAWDHRHQRVGAAYDTDLSVTASDRQGLLRDITDLLSREKINVTAMQSVTKMQMAHIRLTVQVASLERLNHALAAIRAIVGVLEIKRR